MGRRLEATGNPPDEDKSDGSPRGRRRFSTRVRFLLAGALGLLLLVLLLDHAEPDKVLEALGRAHRGGLVAVLLVHLLALLVRVQRWAVILQSSDCLPESPAPAWLLWDSVFFGWLANLLLPARVGEIARPAMYSGRSQLPFPHVLATLVVERLSDLGVVAAFGWLALAVLPGPEQVPELLRSGALWSGVAALSLGAVLTGLASGSGSGHQALAARLPGFVRQFGGRFQEGLASLRKPRAGLHVVGLTAVIWGLEAACVWLALWSFDLTSFPASMHALLGLTPPVSEGLGSLAWSAALAQVVAVTLSISVVTVPAGLGVEQGVTVGLLAAWGVAAPEALALSLVLSFTAAFWILPGGLVALARQGVPQLKEPD